MQGLLETGQTFGWRQAMQGIAHFGEPMFQRAERAAVGAHLPGAVDPFGERAHLALERLDRLTRHRLGQRSADIGEVVAKSVKRVLVGLKQSRDLRIDVAKLLLDPGEV
jgi:hypothetical protein